MSEIAQAPPIQPTLWRSHSDLADRFSDYFRTENLWNLVRYSPYEDERNKALKELVRKSREEGLNEAAGEEAKRLIDFFRENGGADWTKLLEILCFDYSDSSWRMSSERKIKTANSLEFAISLSSKPRPYTYNQGFSSLSRIVCSRIKKDPEYYWRVPSLHRFLIWHVEFLEGKVSFEDSDWDILERCLLTVLVGEDPTLIDLFRRAKNLLEKSRINRDMLSRFRFENWLALISNGTSWLERARTEQKVDPSEAIRSKILERFNIKENVSLSVYHLRHAKSGDEQKVRLTLGYPTWMLYEMGFNIVFENPTTLENEIFRFSTRDDKRPVQFSFIPHQGTNRIRLHFKVYSELVATYTGYMFVE